MTIQAQCGGTLIHPQWVVTAAHCFFQETKLQEGFVHLPDESTSEFNAYSYTYPTGVQILLKEPLFWSFGRSQNRGWSGQVAGVAIERLFLVAGYDNSAILDTNRAKGDIALVKLGTTVKGVDPVPPVSGSYSPLYSLGFGRKEYRVKQRLFGPRLSSLDPLVKSKVSTFAKDSDELHMGRHLPKTCGTGQTLGPFSHVHWYMCTVGEEWEQENGSKLQMAVDEGDSGGPVFAITSKVKMEEIVTNKASAPVAGVELLGVLSLMLVDKERGIATPSRGAAWTDLRSPSSPARVFVSVVLEANSVEDKLGWIGKSNGKEEQTDSLMGWATAFKKTSPTSKKDKEIESDDTASLTEPDVDSEATTVNEEDGSHSDRASRRPSSHHDTQ